VWRGLPWLVFTVKAFDVWDPLLLCYSDPFWEITVKNTVKYHNNAGKLRRSYCFSDKPHDGSF